MARTICFDLDGTLCSNTQGRHERAEPFPWAIERVNELAEAGHRIIILTARGSASGIDWQELTRQQLADWGVRHEELHFGKPQADVYVDDHAIHTDDWRISDVAHVPGFLPAAGAEPDVPVPTPPASTAVVEIARTYGGSLIDVSAHAERLRELGRAIGLPLLPEAEQVTEAAERLVARTTPRPGDDLVLSLALSEPSTPALIDARAPAVVAMPVVGASARRLSQVARGLAPLVQRSGAEGPPVVQAATIRGAARADHALSAWPLLVDREGRLRDGLGATIGAVRERKLTIGLDGRIATVDVNWVCELADEVGVSVERRQLHADELAGADEVFVIATPFCLLAVGSLDGRPVKSTAAGPVARELIEAWTRRAGLDLAAQLHTWIT